MDEHLTAVVSPGQNPSSTVTLSKANAIAIGLDQEPAVAAVGDL